MPLPPPTAAELLGLCSTLLAFGFLGLVSADHAGKISVLDPEYRKHGFCVAAEPTHPFNSYLLCFVCDALICIGILCTRNARLMFGQTCTIFIHGVFHLTQYLDGYPFKGWPDSQGSSVGWGELVTCIFTVVFLGGFGIGFNIGSKLHLVLAAVCIETFRIAFVPHLLGFAYTNAWIFATGTFVAIADPSAAQVTFTLPATVIFVLAALVPYAEGILCNKGFKDLGGHAIFDASIALATLVHAVTVKPPSDAAKTSKTL